MTDLCYNEIPCPSVFPNNGDCETVNHSLKVVGGCLAEGSPVVSSILIQLGSDRCVNGEGGWWGEQFLGFPIGTRLWTLNGRALSTSLRSEIDEAVREALDPLVSQGLIDEVMVRVIDTVDGPEVRVGVFKGGINLLEVAM